MIYGIVVKGSQKQRESLTNYFYNSQTSNIKDTVAKLRRHENIRVIILWMYSAILRNFLKEVRRQNLSG